MSDEIKVNSENTPTRKNLATLGQVKDALDKRDKKIDSLKEDIDELATDGIYRRKAFVTLPNCEQGKENISASGTDEDSQTYIRCKTKLNTNVAYYVNPNGLSVQPIIWKKNSDGSYKYYWYFTERTTPFSIAINSSNYIDFNIRKTDGSDIVPSENVIEVYSLINESNLVTKSDIVDMCVNVLNPNDVLVDMSAPVLVGGNIDEQTNRNGYISTKPLKVKEGETYIFNSKGYKENIIFADGNKKIITLLTQNSKEPFTIPNGIEYMQYSFVYSDHKYNYNKWKNIVMLIKGDTIPSKYIPYKAIYIKEDVEYTKPIDTLTNRKNKAYIILNFDSTESSETGFFSYRKSLLDDYGLKGCPCVTMELFDSEQPQWKREVDRNQYFELLKNGWDVGLYTSVRGDSLDESGWDSKLDEVVAKLEALGICNTVAYHCTGNNLTTDLFNSLKKHGFKIVRCETNNPYYTHFQRQYELTDETLIPIVTHAINNDATFDENKNIIDNAIATNSIITFMAHLVLDTTESIESYNCYASVYRQILAYIKEKVDEGKVEVITWRELYGKLNPYNSKENDYNRLLKLSLLN